ncbi:MAG: hypothetical protein LC781_09400 [Actinobacteria bacterium]|nr:hypothetical protein [Actinomycetota bacterium]
MREDLIIELLIEQGSFWEAVKEVRARWQIEPLAELPLESEHILYPLLRGVPEGYLEDRPPHHGSPPFSEYRLSWYRFAAACVLYNPPVEEDLWPLVEYGGFPLLSGEAGAREQPVLGVVWGQELKERQMQRAISREYDEMVVEKMWELYPEVGESDFEAAKRQFFQRYLNEAGKIGEEAERRVREWHDFGTTSEHKRIELDLETVTSEEVERMLEVVRAREGHNPQGGPPFVRSRVFKVQCAVLLDHRNSPDPEKPTDRRRRKWTHKKLREKFGLESDKVASDAARAGHEEIQKKKKSN